MTNLLQFPIDIRKSRQPFCALRWIRYKVEKGGRGSAYSPVNNTV